MSKPRILVVGSLVLDTITSASRFVEPGETIMGTDYRTAPGGKGANQAVQAARLGAEVTMVGKVGNDANGKILLESGRAAGVNMDGVIVTDDTFTAIANIQLAVGDGTSQNRIIVVPGANMAITPADVAYLEEAIADYDMVILQLEIPMEINEIVARYARAKGVPVMLNSAPYAPLTAALLENVTYISPNETEAAMLTGMPVDSDEQVVEALKAIRAMGVPNALITLGSRGVAYLDENDQLLISLALKNLNVKDPTAAGDSFVGAFCTASTLGLPMGEVLAFANHTAALTVCRMGAQPSLPTISEVIDLMNERGKDSSAFEVLRG